MDISVIIPVYNVSPYLEKCVQSILRNPMTSLEVILIDDGSTDGSGELCDIIQSYDSRVRVFHQSNGGLSSARNCGLSHAQGKWICFVDSDDFVSDDFKACFDRLQTFDCDLLEYGFCVYKDDCITQRNVPIEGVWAENAFFRSKNYYLPVWCYLFKKEILVKYDISFTSGLKYCEDQEFVAKYLLCCNLVQTIPIAPYFYVQREGSIVSSKKSVTWAESYLEIAKGIVEFYIDNSLNNITLLLDLLRHKFNQYFYYLHMIDDGLNDDNHSHYVSYYDFIIKSIPNFGKGLKYRAASVSYLLYDFLTIRYNPILKFIPISFNFLNFRLFKNKFPVWDDIC